MANMLTTPATIFVPTQPDTVQVPEQTKKAAWLRTEVLLVLALVVVGFIAQGLNMFHYPSFTFLDDEGIYTEQAWAVLRDHHLTFYTYFYDHAPAGWILMAGWMAITGGAHTFGNTIDGGRVLMLLLHLAMIPLLFQITRKLGGSVLTASLATLLFSLSPLAIFYQRMVLLDNIMLFWALLSINLLLDGWGRLSRVILSGLCFGLALLSKETAIFLIPAMLFIAYQQRWKHQGRFALSGWVMTVGIIVSWYFLYAAFKGELLPNGQLSTLIGGNGDTIKGGTGVSLINALIWQSSRSGGGMFNLHNDFWNFMRSDWLPRDPLLSIVGSVAVFANLFRGLRLRDRRLIVVSLLGLFPLYYLARGGVVMNYYILFAIPFLCLNLAMLLEPIFKRVSVRAALALSSLAAILLLGGYALTGALTPLYNAQPDQAGRAAVQWIKQNVPAQSYIISRDDMWTDLHEAGFEGPAFPNVHSHWKVGADPAIKNGVFHNDWRTVDYLIMTPGLENSFQAVGNTVAMQAFQHAHLVKTWAAPIGDERFLPHQIVQLWKVDKPGTTSTELRTDSATYLTNHFDQNGAYPNVNGVVTAQAQSAALLRAVWSGDKNGFYQTWNWTQQHLLNSYNLLAGKWPTNLTADGHNFADADSDTALALLLASKRWNDPALQAAGTRMAQAFWQHDIVSVNGNHYVAAGAWATQSQVIVLNPSYFAPYAYRIFQQVDPQHDWQGVIANGYQMLATISNAPFGSAKSAGLPPDWIGLDRSSGQYEPIQLSDGNTTGYGYEAPRTYWRVALDLRWSNDGRASSYLKSAGFLRDEVNRLLADGITHKDRVSAVYKHDGSVVTEPPSMIGTAGAIAALLTLDPNSANTLYAGQLVGGVNRTAQGTFWGDPNDLITQEWGWLTTALYTNTLTDLWTNNK